MPTERIEIHAKNIDVAAGEIIDVLEDTSKGNVIYFEGWGGLGASAILNLVAQRLKSSTRPNTFDKVIHVDCSVWKTMRALQKAVAEELELPQSAMTIFDRCDEDDDFSGIEEGSRGVIADIRMEIFRKLYNNRFVVVFHNGSRKYIDLYQCGVPVISLLGNKVLWTWHVRFREAPNLILHEDGEKKKMESQTDVHLYVFDCEYEEWQDLLHEEAMVVAKCSGIVDPDHIKHKIVMESSIYMQLIAMELKTHAPNYWICDGIIQSQENTSAWEIGSSLQRKMSFKYLSDYDGTFTPYLLQVSDDLLVNRWNFTTHKQLLKDNTYVLPPRVTSFFLSADEPPTNTRSILPVTMFQHSHSSKLRVLHLSHCTFSFASPPFVHCVQLRLLHLDHCTNITDDEEHPSHNESIPCFQKLWVLYLRYTEWYWLLSGKMKRLMVDLRELNVEGVKYGSINDLCGGRPKLVILRVTENVVPTEDEERNNQAELPNVSRTSNITTSSFISDIVAPSLESFSFINKAATTQITSISLRGCSQLKSILLRGNLGSLEELDLSGTTVKTVDLREVEAPNLKRLILVGCEKLRAILWPLEDKRKKVLEKLHISTLRSASSSQNNWEDETKEASAFAGLSSILTVESSEQGIGLIAPFDLNWYISIVDLRLMWSLLPFQKYLEGNFVYMEIGSSPASGLGVGRHQVAQGTESQHRTDQYLCARDIFQEHQQGVTPIEGVISWMWACPSICTPSPRDWYFHMQDEENMERGSLQQQHDTQRISTTVALALVLMCDKAQTLYAHDSSSIICIPCPEAKGICWNNLRWCRVERCPNLCSVFGTPPKRGRYNTFLLLSTFWASQLPMASYIWNWSPVYQLESFSFQSLVLLHLDYCPRLIHVLPLYTFMASFSSLETLEIVCCGDLKEVFPLVPKSREQIQKTIKFPKLRHIHLFELSSLQSICRRRMSAPNLETIKIRGCWGLRRLPAVSSNTTKRPKVDCEKDWWENLEWDGVEANHDPSLYEPRHSRYYKVHLPRGTILR